TTASKPPLRILMLHGFTQSGPLFRLKTRALEKNLIKAFPTHAVSLHYPTAPIRLSPSQLPTWDTDGVSKNDATTNNNNNTNDDDELPDAWAWWVRKGDDAFAYEGIETGFARVAETLKSEGPFDGVIGFSQGGCAAGMVASLLEEGRRDAFAANADGMPFPASLAGEGGAPVHAPLRFCVSYSGFAPTANPLYQAFYEPRIRTPTLHFLGSVDTVVEEKRSLALVEACERSEGRVVYHPGGHFLPSSQKQYVAALVGFIREVMTEAEGSGKEKEEESVEDMDVPF
ncbi:hypothetical protein K490DRAFT_13920, partial [Saccharata proteae CBS 121410]